MLQSDLFSFVEGILRQSLPGSPQLHSVEVKGGGCINQTLKVFTGSGEFFLKWNENGDSFFTDEVHGLELLRHAHEIRVPEVIAEGEYEQKSFLLLEYIAPGYASQKFWEDFGSQLAALHRHTSQDKKYGLDVDNAIGRLSQKNALEKDWITFFINNRLEVQLTLAYYNELVDAPFLRKFRMLYDRVHSLLVDSPPSLIHGDLWSGNYLVDNEGTPVLIDPAVYYANREIEIAYTQLFGGFDKRFYQSYHASWPLEPGFSERADIYNLYPLFVHVNHFGASYLSGIEQTLRRYR